MGERVRGGGVEARVVDGGVMGAGEGGRVGEDVVGAAAEGGGEDVVGAPVVETTDGVGVGGGVN